jgi:hypothetical protein
MYETTKQPLLPKEKFLLRFLYHAAIAIGIVLGALLLGVLGYHFIAGLSWVDSLLNASMILAGMGPVDTLDTNIGKVFASAYALFSGVVFLGSVGVLFAPVYHRFLHRFHLEIDDEV